MGHQFYGDIKLLGEVFEGENTEASGKYSHAEGSGTTASGDFSHAEGNNTTASGYGSHTEGNNTEASGINAHAEGQSTKAIGPRSHAEGISTTSNGEASHAEGINTHAKHLGSHTEGLGTISGAEHQTVVGAYNAVTGTGSDKQGAKPDALFVVGAGAGDNPEDRKDAFAVEDGRYHFNDKVVTAAQIGALSDYNSALTIEQRLTQLGFKKGDIVLCGTTYSPNADTAKDATQGLFKMGRYVIGKLKLTNVFLDYFEVRNGLGTIPSGFRPAKTEYVYLIGGDKSNMDSMSFGAAIRYAIQPDGTVTGDTIIEDAASTIRSVEMCFGYEAISENVAVVTKVESVRIQDRTYIRFYLSLSKEQYEQYNYARWDNKDFTLYDGASAGYYFQYNANSTILVNPEVGDIITLY